jgi:hypothetical protein
LLFVIISGTQFVRRNSKFAKLIEMSKVLIAILLIGSLAFSGLPAVIFEQESVVPAQNELYAVVKQFQEVYNSVEYGTFSLLHLKKVIAQIKISAELDTLNSNQDTNHTSHSAVFYVIDLPCVLPGNLVHAMLKQAVSLLAKTVFKFHSISLIPEVPPPRLIC